MGVILARMGRNSPAPASPTPDSSRPEAEAVLRVRDARAATGVINSSIRQPRMSVNATMVRRLNRSGLSSTRRLTWFGERWLVRSGGAGRWRGAVVEAVLGPGEEFGQQG